METTEREAQIFRDGRSVAESTTVLRRFEARAVMVPQSGRQGVNYKDVSVTGPTTIRIEGPHRDLADELERLLAAAQDIEIGRRDRQWRPAPIDLVIDGETFEGCALDRPTNYFGSVETVEFGVHHERL